MFSNLYQMLNSRTQQLVTSLGRLRN